MERMTDEATEARRAYKRQWRKDHPESVKESNRKFWEKYAARKKKEAQGRGQDPERTVE